MQTISLDGAWHLRRAAAGDPAASSNHLGFADGLRATVPGDVHADLIAAGQLDEPLAGRAVQDAGWVEGLDWWYCRDVEVDPGDADRVELAFGGLDLDAEIWLNGRSLGTHANAHRPLLLDVTAHVRPGRNVLVVRLDDGTRGVADRDGSRYAGLSPHDDVPFMLLRKPQFVFGWDWAPRLVTCGIWRSVELRLHRRAALRTVGLRTRLEPGAAIVAAVVAVEGLAASEDLVVVELDVAGTVARTTALLAGGETTTAQLEVRLEEPALWWPRGYGEPHLHDVTTRVLTPAGELLAEQRERYGLREVALVRDERPDGEGQSFTLTVNGEPIFCKGAGWQPSDCLIARAGAGRTRELVRLAARANLNMLRVWGGGVYESDAFYDACDEYGILVWHDFMYACAYYPDDDPAFVTEARLEARAAVERLRNRACIALWCGNNENQWLHELFGSMGRAQPELRGRLLYDEVLPAVVADLDPDRPYVAGTPLGGSSPNAEDGGTRHAWDLVFLSDGLDTRTDFAAFREDRSAFVAEFGCLGPSDVESLRAFLPPDEHERRDGPTWRLHDNWFESGATAHAIARYWGPIEALERSAYVALGQLVQAEALTIAIEHWRRRKFRTSGALFWGYTDPWGTTHSWAIVDACLRRRAAYYDVARAFAPIALSIEPLAGGRCALWGLNDTRAAVRARLEHGVADVATSAIVERDAIDVELPANAAVALAELELPEGAAHLAAFARLRTPDGALLAHAGRLGAGLHWGEVPFPEAALDTSRDGGELVLRAHTYVWRVRLRAPRGVEVADSHFDLVPGEVRRVAVTGPEGLVERVEVVPLTAVVGARAASPS